MRQCQITKRVTGRGHSVAHCNIKTKRAFKVNMISKRVWVEKLNKHVRIKLSARGLKTLDKKGTDHLFDLGLLGA